MALDTDTIPYLIALPISLPYLSRCAAPRDLHAAIATTRPPSKPLLYINHSHYHVFIKSCGATLNLSKTIDLFLSLCMPSILSNQKTRITPLSTKQENNKPPECLPILTYRISLNHAIVTPITPSSVRLSISNLYSYLILNKTIRMGIVLNNLSF